MERLGGSLVEGDEHQLPKLTQLINVDMYVDAHIGRASIFRHVINATVYRLSLLSRSSPWKDL